MDDAFLPTMVTVLPVLVISLGIAGLVAPIDMSTPRTAAAGYAVRLWDTSLPVVGFAAFVTCAWSLATGFDLHWIVRTVVLAVAVALMGAISLQIYFSVRQKNAELDDEQGRGQ